MKSFTQVRPLGSKDFHLTHGIKQLALGLSTLRQEYLLLKMEQAKPYLGMAGIAQSCNHHYLKAAEVEASAEKIGM